MKNLDPKTTALVLIDLQKFIVGRPLAPYTGAEVLKTPAQAAKWGGTAGIAFDPCYHQACDNLGNVDRVALDRNADGVAWALGVYATSTESVNGVQPNGKSAKAAKAQQRASQRNFSANAVAGDPHAVIE